MFDFSSLQHVCADWPHTPVPPAPSSTSLLERIRQILLAIDGGDDGLAADLVPLVRQAILLRKHNGQHADLAVPLASGWPSPEQWRQAGCAPWVSGAVAHLEAQLPRLAWLGEVSDLFDDACHQLRSRPDYRVTMDPFMAKVVKTIGIDSYLSRGQREALRAMFHLPAGVTLIANLPTGSGKSLLGQAAALVQGGIGRMTIVVVPTVALALDQMRRMKEMLRALDPSWENIPLAYHGGLSQEERRRVRRALADGSQRILFTSPESVTGSLRRPIESAARAGYISTFVIDEAHLVVGWGDAFRPAFQLLPALVRTLRELSGKPIRTVLASATLTANTVKVLQNLFGPPRQTHMVAGVHLRPEPRYASHTAADATERTELVLEALEAAPRPFILYVTERAQAKLWHRRLLARGHKRLALFHGGTADRERERILEDWAENRIDGVIATSAFGLGVDKNDVRAVIHATLPESLDRFYQEVGRGGRDGNACASLLVSEPQDIPLARGIASPTLIGNDNGYERWELMVGRAKHDAAGVSWVDITVRPGHLKQKSRANKAWNLRTLTLMARAGLIELHAVDAGEAEVDGEVAIDNLTRAAVRIIHPGHLNPAVFNSALDKARTDTFGSSELGVDLMVDVAHGRHEMSAVLERIYALRLPGATVGVETCCGGCPHDWERHASRAGYRDPAVRRMPHMQAADLSAWRRRWNLIGDDNTLLVSFPPELFGDVAAMKVVSLLLDSLPAHTLLLAGGCPAALVEAARRQLLERWSSAIFLDRYTPNEDEALYGASGEVRIIVADPVMPLPHALWLSDCALQVVLVPSDLPDAQHPQRRLLDTRAYFNYEDFVSRLIG